MQMQLIRIWNYMILVLFPFVKIFYNQTLSVIK